MAVRYKRFNQEKVNEYFKYHGYSRIESNMNIEGRVRTSTLLGRTTPWFPHEEIWVKPSLCCHDGLMDWLFFCLLFTRKNLWSPLTKYSRKRSILGKSKSLGKAQAQAQRHALNTRGKMPSGSFPFRSVSVKRRDYRRDMESVRNESGAGRSSTVRLGFRNKPKRVALSVWKIATVSSVRKKGKGQPIEIGKYISRDQRHGKSYQWMEERVCHISPRIKGVHHLRNDRAAAMLSGDGRWMARKENFFNLESPLTSEWLQDSSDRVMD